MKLPDLYEENYTISEFLIFTNKVRILNKNNWYGFKINVNGKSVSIKGFNTWLQIFKIDNVDYSGDMDISVKAFKNHLETSIKNACNVSA